MELSVKSQYAILALLQLAEQFTEEQPLQIRQIAAQQNIPDRYLEQLLATLKRQGLVKSLRGAKGGYLLARAPWQISVWDVIQGIEGHDLGDEANHGTIQSESCALDVINDVWQAARLAATNVLRECTLKDLCERKQERQVSTTMYYI
ncbi:MAG: RrF2 family transcriptional regulator [Pseudanabaenaceae cyanobacterium]